MPHRGLHIVHDAATAADPAAWTKVLHHFREAAQAVSIETLEGRTFLSSVTGFTLINPATDKTVGPLNDTAVLNLALFTNAKFALRANTSPSTVGSVRFLIDGKTTRIDGGSPYSLFGNSGADYFGGTLSLGSHSIQAIPYSGSNAGGTAGTSRTIHVSVISQNRPNFLFVYTDDQRYDAMGVVQREQGAAGRFPWLVGQTPNMDRLAAEGVRFRNAFVVDSLCAPSRAALLTGQYGHTNGLVNNHTPFPLNSTTYASLLTKAGYATGYMGKWHMDDQGGKRPGFTYSASFVGQGQYFNMPFQINGVNTSTTGWVDDVTTNYALNFINQQKSHPFAAVVGFKSAHEPFQVPTRLANKLNGVIADPPVNYYALPPYRAGSDPRGPHPDQDRNYFRTILGADEELGKLLANLDRLNLTQNTVVVFMSDNGYYLSDHGLGDKRSAYDESMRVPMIIRYPRMFSAGKVVDKMALNIDIAPTLLNLAGVSIPSQMQGRSLTPLMTGQSTSWRNSFLYEYFEEVRYEPPKAPPNILAVRTDTAKLFKWPGHPEWTELYNLKTDPYEMRNLYNVSSAATLKQQMLTIFDQQMAATQFKVPSGADYPFSLNGLIGG